MEHAQAGKAQAIVTGPIEKIALSFLSGGPWPGQTEYFSHHLGGSKKPFMAFLGGPFIMSMLSVHIPLKKVPDLLSHERIGNALENLAHECGSILHKAPQQVTIAVLGLNPHAGEHGLLGNEEIDHIIPAIKAINDKGYCVSGPWAADGFFGYFDLHHPKPDAVLAMYHDQGLPVLKSQGFGEAINITLGLPFIRTSVDHGTALSLAGTGLAKSSSLHVAVDLALDLASH